MVAALEQVFREEWGRILAALIGVLGDFDRAEEAAQEAFAMASPEVDVHEIKGLLRLRGEGLRSIERLSGLDRKTVRREVTAAQACGAVRGGGQGSRVRATCDTQHVGVMV